VIQYPGKGGNLVQPVKNLNKKIWVPLLVLAIILFGAVLAKPAYYLYKDVTFYWFDRSPTEKLVKAYSEKMHISYGRYPQSLIDLLERNPETQDFVLNYPFREDAEYDLSEFDREEVPLFLQWDERWGYEKYGSDVIGITGCGPTCLAMVGYYLTGKDCFTPEQIAAFAQENDYYAQGYGSSWTLISKGAGQLGLTATELPLVKKKMVDALEAGNPIILAMGKGDFTENGHYIVLTAVEDGAFRVNDPNSKANSQKLWTYEELEHQIRNIWEIRAEQ
jgi:hypothetical protein